VCHVGNGPTSPTNAKLIAAAPDLLDALKRLNRSHHEPCWCECAIGNPMMTEHSRACVAARAAIAKAEGNE
jgi:hypothetical protein